MPWKAIWPNRVAQASVWSVTVHDRYDDAAGDIARIARFGGHTLFQSPEWLEEWYRAAAQHGGLRPVIVSVINRRNQRPAMVLPLVLKRDSRGLVLSFADEGVADYNAPLLGPAAPGDPRGMRKLWAVIARALPAADLVAFEKMPMTVAGRANPLMHLTGARPAALIRSACALRAPFAEARRDLVNPKYARKLDSALRRITEMGRLTFQVAADPVQAAQAFDILAAQKAARAQALGWDSVMDKPVWRDFYRRLALRGPQGGQARLLSLCVDGQPVAGIMGFRSGDAFLDLITAFEDGPWKKCSPGLLVMEQAMAWAAADGVRVYDMTIGAEGFKESYAATVEPLYEFVGALSVKGFVPRMAADLRAFVRARPQLKSWVKGAIASGQTG